MDSKVLSNSRATRRDPRGSRLRIIKTVFKPPFMTASAPPLPFMIVNSSTRWLPEPETFGSKSGRVCRPKAQTGHQPHSFGGRPNVDEPWGKVKSFRLKLLKNFHNRMVGLRACKK